MAAPAMRVATGWAGVLALLALHSMSAWAQPPTTRPGCDPSRWVVAIDPGHYAARPGATSARGLPEAAFNRALATVLLSELRRAGFAQAQLRPETLATESLAGRVAWAQQIQASLYLAIHHDSVQPRYVSRWTVDGQPHDYSDRFSGYSLFVSRKNGQPEASERVARLLGAEFRQRCLRPAAHHAEAIPGEGREWVDATLGIYRFDDLIVLKTSTMPAVLIEAGVIVNRQDELRLQSPAHQALLASAVVVAVRGFCEGAVAVAVPSAAACGDWLSSPTR